MLLQQRGRWLGFVPLVALVLPLTVIACGVPISEAEVAATAANSGVLFALQVEPLATQVSSRSVPGDATPQSAAPQASSIASATGSPLATTPQAGTSVTPTLTPSPFPTGVATANASISGATVTGTPATSTPTVTGTPPTPTATPSPTPGVAAASLSGLGGDALTVLNAERTRLGLRTVTSNPQLTTAATRYAQYMATANFFGHDGPDGSSPTSRATAAGYSGSWRGETLAAGQISAAAAIEVWLNSPPHRVIILDPNIREVGIGYFFEAGDVYGHYWVLQAGVP